MRGMAPSYRARPGQASRAGSMSVSLPFPEKCPACHVGDGRFVSSSGRHETKRSANETISRVREDVRKLAMVTNPANK